MQLILAGVFHLDVPPGNIPLKAVKALQAHPMVASVIPVSLGDNLGGYRIVGTSLDYLAHYQATLAQGRVWDAPMQVLVGATVARKLGLQVGQTFIGSHGLGGSGGGQAHAGSQYAVVGLLAPTGSVLDQLLVTDSASVWQVHEGPGHAEHEDEEAPDKALEEEREVTLALIRYKTPLAAVSFPRFVNSTTPMQAAAPAVEITRLLRMLGIGTDVLRALAGVLLLTAGSSVFIALWSAVRERRADLALLRMLGASPAKIAALLLGEALCLGLLSALIGVAGGQALLALIASLLQLDHSVLLGATAWPVELLFIPALACAVSLFAALFPAWSAYRISVLELLQSA